MNNAKHYKQTQKQFTKDDARECLHDALVVIIVGAVTALCVTLFLNWLTTPTHLYSKEPAIEERYNNTVIVYDRPVEKGNDI